MKHRRNLVAAGVLALAGTSLAGGLGYQAAFAATPSTNHFSLVASAPQTSILFRPCDGCVIESIPDGAHIGGTEIDAGSLADPNGRTVGHYSLQSVGVTPFSASAEGELSLQAVMVIGSDQLVVQGLEEPPDNGGSAAVVGGTGKFNGASGQVQYTDRSDGSTLVEVSLRNGDK